MVLSELLEADFKDLLGVFRHLMNSDATSIEAAYLHLLQLVEDEGAEGIAKMASQVDKDHSDELVHAFASGKDKSVEYKMKSENQADKEVPSLRVRGLNSPVSDEEISAFLNQHLSSVAAAAAASGHQDQQVDEKDEL